MCDLISPPLASRYLALAALKRAHGGNGMIGSRYVSTCGRSKVDSLALSPLLQAGWSPP